MNVTFKDSSSQITLGECINLHKNGVAVIIDEGKHITFEIEG